MSKKIYMGGICGMGMAPLAAFLHDEGNDVFGFDDCPNLDIKKSLEKHSIAVDDCIADKDCNELIISSALVRRKNLLQEKFPNATIMRRGECWANICKSRKLLAVVGSHGKSTVSALLAHAINRLKLDAGYLVGAIPNSFPMHKFCENGKYLVSEIDESDGTIENFSPEITVALNADLDHTDTYSDNSKLVEMFERLFERTKKYVIYPKHDIILSKIAQKFEAKAIGVDAEFEDFTLINKKIASEVLKHAFGVNSTDVLDSYDGLVRRQEVIYENENLFAIADYAHHPNEIKAFINWFEKNHTLQNSLLIFQPHRYTRTRTFAKDFARIFDYAANLGAKIAILDVYPASEPFDGLGTSEKIIELAQNKSIILAKSDEIFKIIGDKLNQIDTHKTNVAIIGAGDFYFDAKEFFQSIK